MQLALIQRVVGILLVLFSSALLPPVAISLWYGDEAHVAFVGAYFFSLLCGLLLWLPVMKVQAELRIRDGFLVVVLFWTVLATVGAVPFLFSEFPEMSVTDAFFESMSGLTTTGATVIVGIDGIPESLRFYRQMLQWLGGMGIIVLAVAVMPMLGIGGMQLFRAETPGPIKDNKLTPRITETAKALWYIYLGLTILCAVAYWAAGMSPFDAVSHSFSTVAIGGFSTHDQSMGYFEQPAVHIVAMVFMLLAGMNFALHFLTIRSGNIRHYLRDTEVRVYLGLILVIGVLCLLVLMSFRSYPDLGSLVRHGLFQVISIGTTTGFTTSGFAWWPVFLPVLLVLLACVGGCAGSTAGGMKVIRAVLLYKQGHREFQRLVHPHALMSVKISGRPVQKDIIDAVWAFFSVYTACYLMLSLAVTATGLDLVSAFSAVASCINNLGPGLGEVAENYAAVSDAGKWLLAATMLLGRLELFTLLVLFTPTFWRG